MSHHLDHLQNPIDRYTGAARDTGTDPGSNFPTSTAEKCDLHGCELINRCTHCCAPVCCPECCRDLLYEVES